MHFLARRAVVWFSSGEARLSGFRRQRRHLYWRPKGRRTSPVGTVSQPIGKPFNGQAKGLLWLTWRSYAGPPQYYIPPEGGALNPSGRRQPVPDRTLSAQGRKARRLAQPSRRSRVNLREYWKAPPRSQSRSRPRREAPEPSSPIGACPYEVSVTGLSFCHRGIGKRMADSGQPIARAASLPPAMSPFLPEIPGNQGTGQKESQGGGPEDRGIAQKAGQGA